MGKASREKAIRRKALARSWMDLPAFIHYHDAGPQAGEKLGKYREWIKSLDLPEGDPIVYAAFPTWREVLHAMEEELKR